MSAWCTAAQSIVVVRVVHAIDRPLSGADFVCYDKLSTDNTKLPLHHQRRQVAQ